MLKHSKHRDALLTILKNVKSHPTAEALYIKMKEENPSISLATVYRNLNLLCETGDITSFGIGDGIIHYDGDTSEHHHFVCTECNKIIDIILPSASSLNAEAEDNNDIIVKSNNLIFYGLCSDCKK